MQMHARLVHAPDEELFHAHFPWNLLEWLLGVADGQRDQNGARPRRNFVDIEPEPVRKQNNLGRNRRNRIVVILPEEAQIDLGESIDLSDATHLQDLLADSFEYRMIGG